MISDLLRNFTSSFIIYGVAAGVSQSLMLILLPFLTNHFDKDIFGAFELLLSFFVFASILATMQFESALSRFYYETQSKAKLVSTSLWIILVLSITVAIIILVNSGYLSYLFFKTYIYTKAICMLALVIPFSTVFNVLAVVTRFELRPKLFLWATLIQVLITIGGVFHFLTQFGWGIEGVFISQMFGFGIGIIILAWKFKGLIVIQLDRQTISNVKSYALPLVPAVMGNWANGHLNKFLMLSYFSLSQIGLYAVAFKVASLFKLGEMAFKMTWPPIFLGWYEEGGHKRKIRLVFRWMVVVLFVFWTVFSLLGQLLIKTFSNDAYLPGTPLIPILGGAFCFLILSSVVGVGPAIEKKTKYNTYAFFIGAFANIICFFWLVPLLGLIGVAYALLIGNIAVFLSLSFFTEKTHSIEW